MLLTVTVECLYKLDIYSHFPSILTANKLAYYLSNTY